MIFTSCSHKVDPDCLCDRVDWRVRWATGNIPSCRTDLGYEHYRFYKDSTFIYEIKPNYEIDRSGWLGYASHGVWEITDNNMIKITHKQRVKRSFWEVDTNLYGVRFLNMPNCETLRDSLFEYKRCNSRTWDGFNTFYREHEKGIYAPRDQEWAW